jgi:hypothetical protein
VPTRHIRPFKATVHILKEGTFCCRQATKTYTHSTTYENVDFQHLLLKSQCKLENLSLSFFYGITTVSYLGRHRLQVFWRVWESVGVLGAQANPCTPTISWSIVHPRLFYSARNPVPLTQMFLQQYIGENIWNQDGSKSMLDSSAKWLHYSSQNLVWAMKSMWMRWVQHTSLTSVHLFQCHFKSSTQYTENWFQYFK